MEVQMKNNIIIAIIAFIVGALGAKMLFPTVKEKTVEIETEKVVKDVQTVIKVVTRPDGTKEEVTTILDKSRENKESKSVKLISKPEWHISANGTISSNPIYGLQVERRIVGDVFAGVGYNTDNKITVSVGIEF